MRHYREDPDTATLSNKFPSLKKVAMLERNQRLTPVSSERSCKEGVLGQLGPQQVQGDGGEGRQRGGREFEDPALGEKIYPPSEIEHLIQSPEVNTAAVSTLFGLRLRVQLRR